MAFDSESDLLQPFKPAADNRFAFNAKKSDPFVADAVNKYSVLHDRIQTLAESKTVGDQPVILAIMKSFPDITPEEMNGIGEALIRIAKLLPKHNELQEQLAFVKYCRENPLLLASIFGEFDFHDITSLTESD